MGVLIHISQQLNNSTTPAFEPTVFQVPSNTVAVNMLLFLSLALVLIDAFLAMLVKGWLKEFDHGWRKHTIAHLRAQERERRLKELEHWKLRELVALLPVLIQGSLLLFCIGLIVLIFPLHLLSAILSSLALVFGVGFYGFTTYVSLVNDYAPFSSPVSRLLARGLAILHICPLPVARNTRRIAPAIPFHSHSLPLREQQADSEASDETTRSLTWSKGLAKPVQPHVPKGTKQSNSGPRYRSDIDPQTHIDVLERLVMTTVEVVENIPIFLELLDRPVKDATLQPSNLERWKELFNRTMGLLREQSTFTVVVTRTLARTMMICYNRKTADQQLYLTLRHHLSRSETDETRSRSSINLLFSSYFSFWHGSSRGDDVWQKIALLEPSETADTELLWMVNTFHRIMQSDDQFHCHLVFFVAVLTYISSTEQSRRSQVPLTAAVIHAMYTIRLALDRGGINSIGSLCILPTSVSTSESVPMTFRQVDGTNALDLWSEDCIQITKDLLQWNWSADWNNDFQFSLIAALYIDSTMQAHARSSFADIVKYTSVTDIQMNYQDAYDHGQLAVFWHMAISQKPLDQDRFPLAALDDVIANSIQYQSILPLSGLHVLEIAVKHFRKTASPSSDWLKREPFTLEIISPRAPHGTSFKWGDYWILLHLETLLAPQTYLLPGEVKELKWPDTPEKVYIANARLELYDSLANADDEGTMGPKPDPELLGVFLWSEDYGVCTRAFKWCLDLVPISQPTRLGDVDSTRIFTPVSMGHEWVEHFIHVLCRGSYESRAISSEYLISHLAPKWNMLPSSWCHDFASAFLFFIVHLGTDWFPAYRWLAEAIGFTRFDEPQTFLPFLVTMLEFIKSSLTWDNIISLENGFADLPESLENQDAYTQMQSILVTRKQQLQEENPGLFPEPPIAGESLEETLKLFAELPMADGWMEEILGLFAELPMAITSEWMDG